MPTQDLLGRLLNTAGAVVGAVGLIYLVGAISLSMRYEGFGLPGQATAAVTPREVLLAAGLRTLVIWVALGLAVVLVLSARDGWLAGQIWAGVRTPIGIAAVAVLVVGLLFVHLLWPLAALLGVLAVAWVTAAPGGGQVRRVIVIALAIGVVAVAYEADRLSYYVEWACVDAQDPQERPCGILVGQQDRGFYLGVAEPSGAARLLFVPASRVARASARKQLATVPSSEGAERRSSIVDRAVGIDVR